MSAGTPLTPRAAVVLGALAGGPRRRRGLDGATLADLEAQELAVAEGSCVRLTEKGRAALAGAQAAEAVGPHRARRLRLELREAEPHGPVLANAAESPLLWLARRKGRDGRTLIGAAQLQAGERLRADFTAAQMSPRITSKWDDVRSGHGRSPALHQSERALDAHRRVRRALDAVGPEFAGLLLDVCCFLKGLDDVERERGWPARSGKVVLQLGLDRLARHYGYGTEARGRARHVIRSWAAPQAALDHDDIGSDRSNVMNVIDSNSLERDCCEKPVPTFSHPALGES